MKSYLEFVFLFQVVLCICTSLLSAYMVNQYIDKRRMIIVVIISNYILVFLYADISIYVVLLIEVVSIFLYMRKVSLMFCHWLLRFMIILAMYALFEGTIYHGIWYMKTTSYQWILVSFVLIMVTYVLLYRCSAFSKLQEYCYAITIEFDDHRIRCYGYWDSGNFANYQQIPIIYLHDKQVLQVKEKVIAIIQNELVEVCQGSIVGVHIPKQKVYIAYIEKDIQNLYLCLLNQLLER